jgi:hypothetical protein
MQPIANKKGHLENIALPDRSIPRDLFGRQIKRGSMRSRTIVFDPPLRDLCSAHRRATRKLSFGHCSRVKSCRWARAARARRNHVGRRGAPRRSLHLNTGRGFRPVLSRKGGRDRNLNHHAVIDAIRREDVPLTTPELKTSRMRLEPVCTVLPIGAHAGVVVSECRLSIEPPAEEHGAENCSFEHNRLKPELHYF